MMIDLSKHQIAILLRLIAIADVQERGAGDYQDWTDADYEAMHAAGLALAHPKRRAK